MARLSVGDQFPELKLESVDGPVELRERWRDGPLVVAFMRHFGWPFCREHLIQLGQAHEEIRAGGGDAVAIFQYRAEPTRNFCRKREVPFDCLGDPLREAYTAVGLEKGSLKEYVGPQLAKGFLRAARHGALPGVPKGDTSQRPGTFVVDPEGRVAFAHYNEDSSDNPSTESVLDALRRAGG